MDHDDLAYLEERASSELKLAQLAGSLQTARPHYRMAMAYLDKVDELQRRLRWGNIPRPESEAGGWTLIDTRQEQKASLTGGGKSRGSA